MDSFDNFNYQQAPHLTEPLTWQEVWTQAITRPSVETFEYLLGDPQVSPNRAYIWIAVSSAVGAVIQLILSFIFQSIFGTNTLLIFNGTSSQNFENTTEVSPALNLIFGVICGIPLAVVGALIFFVIISFILNLIARALGGTGEYQDMVYAMSTYTAPMTIINGVLGGIPIVNLLVLFTGFYAFVLQIIAIKTVHRFGWGQAILTAFVPIIFICGLFACCIFALVSAVAGSQ